MSTLIVHLDTLIVILAAIGVIAAVAAVFYRAGRTQERARWRTITDTPAPLDPREP
jgi:hypothetical protein